MAGIKPGIYRHYKGNQYKVLFEATDSETEEKVVVYQCLYGDYSMWVRSRKMFLETVKVEEKRVPRFELVSEI